MEKLLVVEDEEELRIQLKSALSGEAAIVEASERAGAIKLFLQHLPKVVVLDLSLPPDREGSREGLLFLNWIVRMQPSTKVVLLSSARQRDDAYRALNGGAYDLHQKPLAPAELQVVVRRAFHLCEVEEQSRQLKEALERATAGMEGMAGQCDDLQRLFLARQAAHLETPDWPEELADKPMAASGGEAALTPGHLTLREARDTVEKKMVSEAIGSCAGNMTKASEMLGVSRPALYDLMKKYGICRGGVQG